MKTNRSDGAATYEELDAPDPEGAAAEPEVLELVLLPEERVEPVPRALPSTIEGIVVGRLTGVGDEVRVAFPGAPEAGVVARSMIEVAPSDRGAEVAIMFERGDPSRPVVLGRMAKGFATSAAPEATAAAPPAEDRGAAEGRAVTVTRDGERLVLTAEEEIVLSCGEASITLTRAGKVLVRGAYVSSRATGVNRLQGGSVEIN